MRATVSALFMLTVLAGAAPANAADPKTFDQQAEAWCRWQGGAQPGHYGGKIWAQGCSSHIEAKPEARGAGRQRSEGRIIWDRDTSRGERPRLR